jgi:hypothetical protein
MLPPGSGGCESRILGFQVLGGLAGWPARSVFVMEYH